MRYRLSILYITLFLSIFGAWLSNSFSTEATPNLQSSTALQQTIDAGVQLLFTQTAQASMHATPTVDIQSTIDNNFNLALTSTAQSVQDANYTEYANLAEKTSLSQTIDSPGWRAESIPANPSAAPRSHPAYWTKPGPGADWIRWVFMPSLAGVYKVSVYIPSLRNAPTKYTHTARYHVTHADGTTTVIVDQQANIGNDVDLGTYNFDIDTQYWVFLDDNTGESGNIAITGDTVSWQFVPGSSHIDFVQPLQPTPPRGYASSNAFATTLDNARIWSEPDAKAGKILSTLPPGTEVLILNGPIQGPIRWDSDVQGLWFQVSLAYDEAPLGWIWADRLSIHK